ncbi:MAG: glycosyltransferase [Candidatus Saccharibacteria bacterium]|nr:glycosyltransferase [Microbacteriaceae bacterium]
MARIRPGVVSVVLVNFRGTDDTITAVRGLEEQDWPADRYQVIVVENGSGDNSAERLRTALPGIRLIVSKSNLGFAGGCNLGVAKATGEYLAFLNNDARPDARWIRSAVERFESDPTVGAVASKVLDWEGANVDFIDAALTWFGQGYKPLTAQPVPRNYEIPSSVLFGTGSAMFVRASDFAELGGFDERFFMFFEDVDLGWRLNLAGRTFAYEPSSIAFHKHHASMTSFGAFKEQYLLERNALFTLYKNAGDQALAHLLPATLALTVRRAVARGGLDSEAFDLRRGDKETDDITVSKQTMAGVFAIDQFVAALPELEKERERIQSGRKVTDQQIAELFGQQDAPSYQDKHYLAGYDAIVDAFGVLDAVRSTRVLVITGDPIGAKMAGPAIRAWHIAQALSSVATVTLVSLSGHEPVDAPFELRTVRPYDDRAMAKLEKSADVIVFQGDAMDVFDSIRDSTKVIVVDVYDPMHLEQLEQGREQGPEGWTRQVQGATDILNEQLSRADFMMCASERQKHFYLGQLAALGRLTPTTYSDDPDFSKLISVVPFGLRKQFPASTGPAMRGVVPGIGVDDKILLWSGGLYNWFDPLTLIRAVADASTRHDNLRLFFLGTRNPNPNVPEMGIVAESRALAAELGVLGTSVFFNDSWVDYADRHNYLAEADLGVSTHFNHIETTFSFRTRILDYLWASLPMVVTRGDHFAELVEREGLGIAVDAEDVSGLAAAIETILYEPGRAESASQNASAVRQRFLWSTVLAPLVEFIRNPRHAPDIIVDATGVRRLARSTQRARGLRRNVDLARYYLRAGGPMLVVRKVRSRLGRAR